jgi:hypothetical protein
MTQSELTLHRREVQSRQQIDTDGILQIRGKNAPLHS